MTVSAGASTAEDGTPLIAAVVRDRADQAARDERLRVSEERLVLAAEAAAGVVFDWDLRSERIERSPGLAELLGFRPDEADPTHPWWVGRIHPQDLPGFQATVGRVSEERRGRLYSVEYRVRHKDGTHRWIESRAVALRDGRGEAYRLVGIHADITERRRAEDSLRAVFEQTTAGMVQIDPDGRIVLANRWFCDFVGYGREELLTMRMQDITHPDDLPRNLEVLEKATSGGGNYQIDKRYVRKDGSVVWGSVSSNLVRDAEGRPQAVFGVITDITEGKRTEQERIELLAREQAAREELEQAGRAKDEFLATLSHELRTPLNAILGWSQVLKKGAADAEDLRQGLDTIERNARAQAQIIEDLLDMSRIISGKVRLEVQRLELAPVVRAAVETVRPAADAKGVFLQVVLDPLAGPVSGDPNRLQQVFCNLLTNAVKFTPRGGRVQVLLERVGSHLEVGVVDTGEGISPQFLPHVFDRFRQSDASTTRRHGGLGLGLSIVKQLVELHGGSVRAKSPGVGRGTTFRVTLPLMPVHAEPEPPGGRRHPRAAVAAGPGADISGLRVLVVDDEADARALVRRVLEEFEATVLVAATAAEALDLLRAERPDVLVSDIGMPQEDGYWLIRRVRALPPKEGGVTPAVALTAYARPDDRMRAVSAGFQQHVSKPVEPAELVTMVASLTRRGG